MGKKLLGLSLEKDAGYSKLIVVCSALLSGFTFGLPAFQGVLTAQWKVEYGFPQEQASLHQRYFQGFLYFGSMILSAFYKKLGPRTWLAISSLLGVVGYFVIFIAFYLPMSYFPMCQVAMGILAGAGAGLSFGIICITPQHWLDKTQQSMNPYLFIGAPIMVTLSSYAGGFLINQYTWSGAHLIMIGFFLQQAIVAALFLEHPSELTQAKLAEEDEKTFTDKVGEYKAVLAEPGLVPMLFNCAICSGFIMSGVFTEISNVAMENGLEVWQASTLVTYSAIPEIFFRPLWGQLTKELDVATLQVIWCLIFMISQFLISIATTFPVFIAGMVTFSLGLAGYSGLKFVILIKLVGGDKLPNALFFDTLFDAIMTIIVPTICGWINQSIGNTKVLFYVNCVAAFLCMFTSIYIRGKLNIKAKKNEESEKKEVDNRDDKEMLAISENNNHED